MAVEFRAPELSQSWVLNSSMHRNKRRLCRSILKFYSCTWSLRNVRPYLVIGSEKTCHVANLLILQNGPYSRRVKKKKKLLDIFSKLSSLLSYYENLLP